MHISEILKKDRVNFSFEFFPPKTDESSRTLFVSVTYGAGGSTTELTQNLVARLQKETPLNVVAHLTSIGGSRADIQRHVEKYAEAGIQNVLALRGDPPKNNPDFAPASDGFQYAAEMVAFIRKHFPHFGIGVAGFPEGHPATPNRMKEMEYLKAKVDAGADYICTQLFFENRDYYDFCERCELAGIKVPILAGIMPLSSLQSLKRIPEMALGARIPARLLRAVQRAENNESVEKIGIHWATEQVFDLYDHHVAGIHFYTLNRSKATLRIYETLGMSLGESWSVSKGNSQG
jgi:methylenetetrahydrofolate reductase (NADPH)